MFNKGKHLCSKDLWMFKSSLLFTEYVLFNLKFKFKKIKYLNKIKNSVYIHYSGFQIKEFLEIF